MHQHFQHPSKNRTQNTILHWLNFTGYLFYCVLLKPINDTAYLTIHWTNAIQPNTWYMRRSKYMIMPIRELSIEMLSKCLHIYENQMKFIFGTLSLHLFAFHFNITTSSILRPQVIYWVDWFFFYFSLNQYFDRLTYRQCVALWNIFPENKMKSKEKKYTGSQIIFGLRVWVEYFTSWIFVIFQFFFFSKIRFKVKSYACSYMSESVSIIVLHIGLVLKYRLNLLFYCRLSDHCAIYRYHRRRRTGMKNSSQRFRRSIYIKIHAGPDLTFAVFNWNHSNSNRTCPSGSLSDSNEMHI